MAELFLDSLEIQNFRAFEHLKIEKLGRVNLIVGKNSVGKTSLLEALSVYANHGSLQTLLKILERRKEFSFSTADKISLQNPIAYIFHDQDSPNIIIGSLHNPTKKIFLTKQRNIIMFNRKSLSLPENLSIVEALPNAQKGSYRFDKTIQQVLNESVIVSPLASNIFLQTTGLTEATVGELWNKIVVTDLETQVIKAIQIINKDIARVAVVENNSQQIIYVGFTGSNQRVTLQSLGEGVSRIFQVILAIVNCQNGILLVDEIENGLYHKAQLDLWKVIFELANHLNVQVFATTHSWDCIAAFQEASAQDEHEEAMLISLRNKSDGIVPITYDERRLEIATSQQIEVR